MSKTTTRDTLQFISHLTDPNDPKPIKMLKNKVRFNKPIEPTTAIINTLKNPKKRKKKK